MNERELAEAERMLNDARVRTKPKIRIARAGTIFFGFVAGTALLTVLLGVAGVILGDVEPSRDLRLQPEGIADVTRPEKVSLLSYADVDAVARVGSVVEVRAGGQTLDVEAGNSGLVSLLHRYLEAHVRAARALAEERRVARDFLVRVDATPDYRHAGAPASALEAIARARGMPLALRVEAARAIELTEDDIGVTEELKRSKTMFEE